MSRTQEAPLSKDRVFWIGHAEWAAEAFAGRMGLRVVPAMLNEKPAFACVRGDISFVAYDKSKPRDRRLEVR